MCQLCSSSMPAGMLLACMPVSFTSALSPSMAMVSVMYDTVPMAASVSPTGSTAMMFCNRAKYGHSRCRLAAGQQQRVCCQAADSSLYCERRLRPFWEAIELARLSGEFVCSADTFLPRSQRTAHCQFGSVVLPGTTAADYVSCGELASALRV